MGIRILVIQAYCNFKFLIKYYVKQKHFKIAETFNEFIKTVIGLNENLSDTARVNKNIIFVHISNFLRYKIVFLGA